MCRHTYIYIYVYYIYKKLSPKWKNCQEQNFFFDFTCEFLRVKLCEIFSKIGPIIKKISNFVNDPHKIF